MRSRAGAPIRLSRDSNHNMLTPCPPPPRPWFCRFGRYADDRTGLLSLDAAACLFEDTLPGNPLCSGRSVCLVWSLRLIFQDSRERPTTMCCVIDQWGRCSPAKSRVGPGTPSWTLSSEMRCVRRQRIVRRALLSCGAVQSQLAAFRSRPAMPYAVQGIAAALDERS